MYDFELRYFSGFLMGGFQFVWVVAKFSMGLVMALYIELLVNLKSIYAIKKVGTFKSILTLGYGL